MQDEILKHTKRAFAAMNKPDSSFGHKIREILLEVAIIVFAVSLSIWLHGWSEHRHQQAEVNEFLIDLKEDLTQDVERLKNSKKKLTKNLKDYKLMYSLTQEKVDSVEKTSGSIEVAFNAELLPTNFNTANYEGFKSSGKIGQIENKILKRQILGYYQGMTNGINDVEKIIAMNGQKIINTISENLGKDDKYFFETYFKQTLKQHIEISEDLVKIYDVTIKEANSMLKNIDNAEK